MNLRKILVFFVCLHVLSAPVYSASRSVGLSVQECYSIFLKSFEEKKWKEVINYSQKVLLQFPSTPFAEEARYYQAVAYFYLNDFDLSNRLLSVYLKQSLSPKFFEEALSYKFLIAEKYRGGAKKHLFGSKKLPSWSSAKEEAVKIYDEIAHALPSHPIAAKALYSKGDLLLKMEEFSESISTLESLIRNFPNSEQALDGFLLIAKNYLKQINPKQQDLDLLAKAEINIRKFREAFPQEEERILEASNMLSEMKEIYASSLFEVGQFFERTKKKNAARIYYTRIISQFPQTKSAELSQKRMNHLK
jgi:outer membrane protein assembly factor BamD (BamD/ComL family)